MISSSLSFGHHSSVTIAGFHPSSPHLPIGPGEPFKLWPLYLPRDASPFLPTLSPSCLREQGSASACPIWTARWPCGSGTTWCSTNWQVWILGQRTAWVGACNHPRMPPLHVVLPCGTLQSAAKTLPNGTKYCTRRRDHRRHPGESNPFNHQVWPHRAHHDPGHLPPIFLQLLPQHRHVPGPGLCPNEAPDSTPSGKVLHPQV